jgi:hypothetical protein
MKSSLGLNIPLENTTDAFQRKRGLRFQTASVKFAVFPERNWCMIVDFLRNCEECMQNKGDYYLLLLPVFLDCGLKVRSCSENGDGRSVCIFRYTGREICAPLADDHHVCAVTCYSSMGANIWLNRKLSYLDLVLQYSLSCEFKLLMYDANEPLAYYIIL